MALVRSAADVVAVFPPLSRSSRRPTCALSTTPCTVGQVFAAFALEIMENPLGTNTIPGLIANAATAWTGIDMNPSTETRSGALVHRGGLRRNAS